MCLPSTVEQLRKLLYLFCKTNWTVQFIFLNQSFIIIFVRRLFEKLIRIKYSVNWRFTAVAVLVRVVFLCIVCTLEEHARS
jgi:hypothetical protein